MTISLDPNLDFCPFLQLHKPGLDGVCLSTTTWQEIMSVKGYISSFYKGELSWDRMQDVLLLGPIEKIMFKFQYNWYVVSIKSNTDDKKEVVLAHTTWNRPLDLAPYINDCLTKLSTWQCEAMEMFVAFAHAIKAKSCPRTLWLNVLRTMEPPKTSNWWTNWNVFMNCKLFVVMRISALLPVYIFALFWNNKTLYINSNPWSYDFNS